MTLVVRKFRDATGTARNARSVSASTVEPIYSEGVTRLAVEVSDVRRETCLEFSQLVLVDNFPFAVVVHI